jgi:uncharacterized protein (UPF0261 family)
MSRLKDEIIEQIDRLGDVLDLCTNEVQNTELDEQILCETNDDFIHFGRKELAEAILKIIKGEDE